MLHGGLKYGSHNYRVVGVRASIYFSAACRHLDAYWEGEDIDPESGLPHIVMAMAGLAVLRDCQSRGMCSDDRPPATLGHYQQLNEKAKQIIESSQEDRGAFTWRNHPGMDYQMESTISEKGSVFDADQGDEGPDDPSQEIPLDYHANQNLRVNGNTETVDFGY